LFLVALRVGDNGFGNPKGSRADVTALSIHKG
jgi:hypothetical protein